MRGWRSLEREGSTLSFPEQYSAAPAQVADNRGVGGTNPSFIDGRAVLGRETFCLDDVLHAKWNTGELALSRCFFR